MALWFPLMVNTKQIGEVEIVRRCDEGGCDRTLDEGRTFTYDWKVSQFSQGITQTIPKIVSGEVEHAYSDGAYVLVGKVMNAYAKVGKALAASAAG